MGKKYPFEIQGSRQVLPRPKISSLKVCVTLYMILYLNKKSDKKSQFQKMSTKNWTVTVNNYVESDYALFKGPHVKYSVYGKEVAPTTGTPHLQGYIVFKQNMRLAAVKKLHSTAHWEASGGSTDQNFVYATKDCTVDNPFVEYGTKPVSKRELGLKEIDRWAAARLASKEGRFDDIDPDIYMRCKAVCHSLYVRPVPQVLNDIDHLWIYGPPGTGKTKYVYDNFNNFYIKSLTKWWCGYNDEEVVFIDEMAPFHRDITQLVKVWADRYPFRAESKGGSMVIRPKKIIVCSNYSIEDVWEDAITRDAMNRRFTTMWMPTPCNLSEQN